jgi:hypothetical protein
MSKSRRFRSARSLAGDAPPMTSFLWMPGEGIDLKSLERLCLHFPQPRKPMGEAWFMGEDRHLHVKLLGQWNLLTAADLQQPLEDIVSGTACFGAMDEWTSWYHFLIGALLSESQLHWLDELFEMLLSGFMLLYPYGIQKSPYKEFRDDALSTLGRCLMVQPCWSRCNGEDASDSNDSYELELDRKLSASMFFCLKYLPEVMVAPWLRSACVFRRM